MPENRSEAFEGKFSFKPFKQRPKLRPESIIKRPEKKEPVVKTKEKEFSWSRNQVDRFGKRYREEGKLPPVKKVDTSGNSIYKAANMQIPKPPKQNRTSRGVEALEGPEALAMVAPKPRGVGVFDRIKNFFTPPEAPTGGVDPSGLMSPSPMTKYKIAIAKDQKKELTNTSEIKIAQTLLTNMGYTPYGIDGKIGNGTRRAVRKLQAQHGLEITGVLSPVVLSLLKSSVVQDFPDKPDNKAVPITFDAKDLSTYSNVISQIESKGKYNIMGGAGKTYVGKYQLGEQALTDLNYGYTDAKIKALLADPDKQEELFKEYTEKNHKELTRISSEYRNMSKEEQLGILGYAHNQGAVGAAEFLFTGVVGSDAFDTEGTEFTKAVIEAFGWTAEGEKFAEENKDSLRDSFPELKQWTETSQIDAGDPRNIPPGAAVTNLSGLAGVGSVVGAKLIDTFKNWKKSTAKERQLTKQNWQPSSPGDLPPWIEIPKNKLSKASKVIDNKIELAKDLVKVANTPVVKNMINDMLWGGEFSLTPVFEQLGGGVALKSGNFKKYKPMTRVAGAEIYSPGAIDLMRDLALKKGLKPGGTVTIKKADIYNLKGSGISVNQRTGSSAGDIIEGLLEGNPVDEVKLMMGQFEVSMDMDGKMTTDDQFNYNDFINPIDGQTYTAEQYNAAIEAGDFTHLDVLKAAGDLKFGYPMIRAVAFVLGSKDYKGEDNPLDEGRYMRVDLGKAP